MKAWNGHEERSGLVAHPRPVLDDDVVGREVRGHDVSGDPGEDAEEGRARLEARDGAEALWVMQHDPPAMVILDVQMPGVDGPTFARELRMGLKHVPLVVVTAADDPRHEADRCNAEAFLAKPYDSETLLSVVRKFAS